MHMPTVKVINKLLFIIHTNDHNPPHVTIYFGLPESHEAKARVEIDTGIIMCSFGFSVKSLRMLQKEIVENKEFYYEKWTETRPA